MRSYSDPCGEGCGDSVFNARRAGVMARRPTAATGIIRRQHAADAIVTPERRDTAADTTARHGALENTGLVSKRLRTMT